MAKNNLQLSEEVKNEFCNELSALLNKYQLSISESSYCGTSFIMIMDGLANWGVLQVNGDEVEIKSNTIFD